MSRVACHTQIAAPPEAVWDVVTDVGRLGEWVTIHRGVRDAPDTITPGATFSQDLEVAGRGFTVAWEAVEVDPPRLLVWRGAGPARTRAETSYRLAPEGDGTRFDYENEFTLPGGALGRLVGGAISGRSRREGDASLERLRALVERAGGG